MNLFLGQRSFEQQLLLCLILVARPESWFEFPSIQNSPLQKRVKDYGIVQADIGDKELSKIDCKQSLSG